MSWLRLGLVPIMFFKGFGPLQLGVTALAWTPNSPSKMQANPSKNIYEKARSDG